jgi:predicted unusual protein kinase regulating ubiquinone biosynthesis (AarF/ABC1/UbiB family)
LEEAPHGAAPSLQGIEIEPAPFRWGLAHRWHRGVLDDDRAVIVKTVRPTLVAALEQQVEELPMLETLRLEELGDVGAAVESYLVWLERQVDLRRELRGLRRLADEAPHFDALLVPRLWEEHSSRETLVSSDPGGRVLAEACSEPTDEHDRGRRLCSAWLEQALLESVLPEGPPGDNLRLLEDGRVAVTGGLFTSLGRKLRRDLLDALVAASRGDPDSACEHLLDACDAELEDADLDRLQVAFRQAEPFRDGGWSDSYHGRRLADTLCVQWRLLQRAGVDIPAPVVAYLRSLHDVETCARRLDPEHDAFAEAVDDLAVVAAATRMRENLSVRRLRGVLEAAPPVLRELAKRADSLGASPDTEANGPRSKRAFGRREWSEVGGLLLLMAATALCATGLHAAGVGGAWLQAAATTVFVAVGAVALWRVWRHGR